MTWHGNGINPFAFVCAAHVTCACGIYGASTSASSGEMVVQLQYSTVTSSSSWSETEPDTVVTTSYATYTYARIKDISSSMIYGQAHTYPKFRIE